MDDKQITWVSSSREDLRAFPEEAKRKAGLQLRAIQRGDPPTDFKPMSVIGKGVYEIRIKTEDSFRVFYVARFDEAVYVLHAFQKKTQKTAKHDIETGQQRYQQMLEYRKTQTLEEHEHE
jgi:phage-related protein